MAEAVGTAFLLVAVVGSGIVAERLADGNTAIALLANSLATGAGLFALIIWLAPISGAHLNPVITLGLVVCRERGYAIPSEWLEFRSTSGVLAPLPMRAPSNLSSPRNGIFHGTAHMIC
jgi:hypothetical protein